jgi:quinol-cytochrome oxidoreductase complex cytochrome b subunit
MPEDRADVADWLDDRSGWRAVWGSVFLRTIPRTGWSHTLGSATLIAVVNQFLTGILLSLYYVPSPEDAYASVQYITDEVPAGWLIRGMHHWGATALVLLAVAHMVRVIVHGAYKFPREVTWFTGVGLLVLVLGFGFTGYLLPWDQKAFWASSVGTQMADVTPLIGDWLLSVLRGGETISAVTLTRFFGIHVWVLPALLLGLLGVHLFLVVRIGISAPPEQEE